MSLVAELESLVNKWSDEENYGADLFDESPDPWVLAERHANELRAVIERNTQGTDFLLRLP